MLIYGMLEEWRILYEKPGFNPDTLVPIRSFLIGDTVGYYSPQSDNVDDNKYRNPTVEDLGKFLDKLRKKIEGKDEAPPKHNSR